jgi:hypothetical protein
MAEIGPQPNIRTISPFLIPPVMQALRQFPVGSAITAAFRERPFGIFTTLVEGIKQYSAKPP